MATTTVYGPAAQSLLAGEFGVLAGSTSLRCALFTSTYVPTGDERYFSALTGEVADASYARQTLTNVTVTYDAVADTTILDCDDVTFPNLTASIRYIVFFRHVETAAVFDPAISPLLLYWNLGAADEVSSAAPYVVTIDATGLLRLTKGA